MKIGWYSALGSVERKTYWSCFGGYVLDAFDSTIYSLAMPILLTIGFLSKSDAGILSSASLIGSALGGWSAGRLADRFGRTRVLRLTVIWLSLFTLLTAFCTSFWQFLPLRFLQGLGYGGEMVVCGVLISEVIRARVRGRVAASIQSGYAIGNALSLATLPVVLSFFSQEIAWRIFFTVGTIPAVLLWWLRRSVPESPVFYTLSNHVKKSGDSGIFSPIFLRLTVTGTLFSSGVFGGAYIMITWLPTYLRITLGLPVTSMSGYLCINILGSLLGPFICGYISDRLGRWRTMMLFLCLQALVVGIYMFADISLAVTLILGFFLGAFQGGLASGITPAFSELYPTRLRGAGAGFCASFGRGFGSLMPAAVGILATHMALGRAMGLLAIAAYTIAFITSHFLPDATGVGMDQAGMPHERTVFDETTRPDP
jgi:MFS family permease